jgi:hypothetical protein
MEMTLSPTPGALKKIRRTPWRYQQTFVTPPLKDLQPFVAGVISCLKPVQAAAATVDEVVFEPRNLNALLARRSIIAKPMDNTNYLHDWSLSCTGEDDVGELLRVLLGDWIDFTFVPTPKRFVIFADHDEYITFLSVTKSHLNRVVRTLTENGFQPVRDYQRRF